MLAFRLFPLRLTFRALDAIRFPAGQSTNILRGAFGIIFRGLVCDPQCPGAKLCPKRESCPYARVFEPHALQRPGAPSGLVDRPRPFVFRAAHLDDTTFRSGQSFHFDLNLFDMQQPAIGYFSAAFAQLVDSGLGPWGGRAELISVYQLHPAATLYEDGRLRIESPQPMVLPLDPPSEPVHRLRVFFRTPTELKEGGGVTRRPDFALLAARMRDRVSALRQFYDEGPLPIDFRAFKERAAKVRMTSFRSQDVAVRRHSSKTKQTHPIGGFVGEAEYEGDLTEFVPYLEAARWTGVGRQTVWGKGAIEWIAPHMLQA